MGRPTQAYVDWTKAVTKRLGQIVEEETRMTPALPALDALLKEVEAAHANGTRIQGATEDFETFWHRVHTSEVEVMDAAPRLAAIVRVAVEALRGAADPTHSALHHDDCRFLLSRIERIAAGDSVPPEGQALAKGEGA